MPPADGIEGFLQHRLGPLDVAQPGQEDSLHREGRDKRRAAVFDLQRRVDVLSGRCQIPRVSLGRREVRQGLAHPVRLTGVPVEPQGIFEEGDRRPGLPDRAVHDADVVCAHGHALPVPDGGIELLRACEVFQGPCIAAPLVIGRPPGGLLGARAEVTGNDGLLPAAARGRQDRQNHQQAALYRFHSRLTSSGLRPGPCPPASGGGFP